MAGNDPPMPHRAFNLTVCASVMILTVGLTVGTDPTAASATGGSTSRFVTSSSPRQDTYVNRSLIVEVGSKPRLKLMGGRGHGLVSFVTPVAEPEAEAVPVSARVCVTPVRTTPRTRLAVYSAPSEWDEGTTWATRPRLERNRLGRSARALKAGRRTCIRIPVAALEPGETELRLRPSRFRGRIILKSSEARTAPASLKVKWRGKKSDRDPATPPADPSVPPTDPSVPPADPSAPPEQGLLWDGGFDSGGIPHGANGPRCDTGIADGPDAAVDQYTSVEQAGNTTCANKIDLVKDHTRTPDSKRALKIVLAPGEQREQPQSRFTWVPDDRGTVDQWYGFSFFYDDDWNQGGGLAKEVSGSYWHNPLAFRMDGDNGSLNFSGDMDLNNANGRSYEKFTTPHLILRRNTVQNANGLYKDGAGLDKLDLGPIVTNKWMDIVCHIRWSTTATNALRECWRDGTYMGSRTTRNAVDNVTHRLRVGQYQTTEIKHSRTTYMDNVRVGTSYAVVDPSVSHS